jgi:hypothetical protein
MEIPDAMIFTGNPQPAREESLRGCFVFNVQSLERDKPA